MILLTLALAISSVTVSSTGVTISGTNHAKAGAHSEVVPVECSAFHKNADGSWNSVKATKVGSTSISPGVTLSSGVTVNGVDIGESLDATCSQAATTR